MSSIETAMLDFSKRRVLISDRSTGPFQILSIAQETDGSIYLSCPDFAEAKWLELSFLDFPSVAVVSSPGLGKISIHTTGFAAIRAHDSQLREVKVMGTPLIDEALDGHFVRHLCTLMISLPSHKPNGQRKSDYQMNSSKALMPTAFVLFAIPKRLGLNRIMIQPKFHVDVIGIPPEVSWGEIPLKLHTILWIAYTTTLMTTWPRSTHFCHFDGNLVPLFMGGGPEGWSLTVVKPELSVEQNRLVMVLDASSFDGVVSAQ